MRFDLWSWVRVNVPDSIEHDRDGIVVQHGYEGFGGLRYDYGVLLEGRTVPMGFNEAELLRLKVNIRKRVG